MAVDGPDLIQRAKTGDRDATGKLLEQYASYLRAVIQNHASSRLLSWVEIDDLLQIVFLKVFLSMEGFQTGGDDGFRRWIGTIAHHTVIDAARSIKPDGSGVIPPLDMEQSYRALVEIALVDSVSPSRDLTGKELVAQLDQAMARLPEVPRNAIKLYDLEGKKFEEVAKALGCSTSKAFTARARGLLLLRDFLA